MQKKDELHKRPNLRKAIGVVGFFSLAFGSIIGVGWVTAFGSWLSNAGPVGAMLAFLLGGLLMLLIGLCYAEVTPMLPVAGGEVAYAYKAFGVSKSFIVGWALAFGYLSVSAFEAISIGKVLGYMFPGIDRWPLYSVGGDTVFGAHVVLAFLCTAFITWVNYVGVGQAARLQTVLTFGFIAVTLVFIGAGFWGGESTNLQPIFSTSSASGIAGGVLAVFVTVPFWFVGFDTIPQGAEEAKAGVEPRKLGILILIAIVSATAFYIVLIYSAASAGPWQNIVNADLPTARAFEWAFQSPFLVNLVLTAALIGLFTSWNGFFLAGSRVLFALGRGRILSAWFGQTHEKHGTPANAVLFSGAITFVAALMGRGAMIAFVDVGSLCIVVAFLGVSLSVIRLRRDFPAMQRPYRMPGGLATARIAVVGSAFILAVMLVPFSPAKLVWPIEWLILGFFTILGLAFWVGGKRRRNSIAEKERGYLILEDYS